MSEEKRGLCRCLRMRSELRGNDNMERELRVCAMNKNEVSAGSLIG